MPNGPMHMVVIALNTPAEAGELKPHLAAIQVQGLVRMVDTLLISKDESSELSIVDRCVLDPEEATFNGLMERAFLGNGLNDGASTALNRHAALDLVVFGMTDDDLFEVADKIPAGSLALFLLFEHLWVAGLLESIAFNRFNRGAVLAQGWITPETLRPFGESSGEAMA